MIIGWDPYAWRGEAALRYRRHAALPKLGTALDESGSGEVMQFPSAIVTVPLPAAGVPRAPRALLWRACTFLEQDEATDFCMGFYDSYMPRDRYKCPVCGAAVASWQGTDGPCALLVWREGIRGPVDQLVDEELRIASWPNPRWVLPDRFSIRSHDCGCPYAVEAAGHVVAGVWVSTEVVTLDNAKQHKHESREQFAGRLRWLKGRSRR